MASDSIIDALVRSYGNLLFDLCTELIIHPPSAQMAFKNILKTLRNKSRFQKYEKYERSWVLHTACQLLLRLCAQQQEMSLKKGHIKWDIQGNLQTRLKQFSLYLGRLNPEDQILLLLKDKHRISYQDISIAMGIPIGSLKIKHQQALVCLDEWLWKKK